MDRRIKQPHWILPATKTKLKYANFNLLGSSEAVPPPCAVSLELNRNFKTYRLFYGF